MITTAERVEGDAMNRQEVRDNNAMNNLEENNDSEDTDNDNVQVENRRRGNNN